MLPQQTKEPTACTMCPLPPPSWRILLKNTAIEKLDKGNSVVLMKRDG